MTVLVLAEHDRGVLAPSTLEALTAARPLGPVSAVSMGEDGDRLGPDLALHGAETVHQVHHELLTDYGPDLWAEALAQLVARTGPDVVLAAGTDRGNEVMAHLAARMDLPMAADCTAFDADDWSLTRIRWGGSLNERAALDAPTKLLTIVEHSTEASPSPSSGTTALFTPELGEELTRTRVVERVVLSDGVTLATASVVVGGGRGVGSPEGFAALEDLADLLGGVVGCSRVVTNNGWRPHTDQVGQTGTRIAPEIYVACGISGAIQHLVGAMPSKRILAINTDPEANIVGKADYAVIGDLHEIVPAIAAEIRRRRSDKG